MKRHDWMLGLCLAACSESQTQDAGPADARALDAEISDGDTGVADAATPDSGSDAGVSDAGPGAEVFGFTLRVPSSREVACTGTFCPNPTVTADDVDFVCDFNWNGLSKYVYVQSHGVSWLDFMGYLYEVDGAWVSDGTTASPTTATYSWGGNHHNDSMTVDIENYQVRFDHSSFGFGFRKCQPMDCAVVFEAGPGAELANGCGRDRTVPVICKPVRADGTIETWEDTFERCAGDT